MPETALLWLLVAVPIAAQLPLFWYAMSKMEIERAPDQLGSEIWGGEEEDGADYRRRLGEGGPTAARTGAADGTTRCRNCGTENDPDYRYCQGCARRL